MDGNPNVQKWEGVDCRSLAKTLGCDFSVFGHHLSLRLAGCHVLEIPFGIRRVSSEAGEKSIVLEGCSEFTYFTEHNDLFT